MNTELQNIALRLGNLYLPGGEDSGEMTPAAAALVKKLSEYGYSLSEEALHAVNALSLEDTEAIAEAIANVYGIHLNWSSLIKHWLRPTGETWLDHRIGYFANFLPKDFIGGTELPCGHVIPDGLFDLNRYNGCPLCGKPFHFETGALLGGAAPKKVLGRMTEKDLRGYMSRIIASPLPPSANEAENLVALSEIFAVPDDAVFGNIETRIILACGLFKAGKYNKALALIPSPAMLLRMLWHAQTGQTRIIKKFGDPKLRLHFTRTQCKAVAQWFDTTVTDIDAACEQMNPCREMWVRYIRALRLPEYAKRLKAQNLLRLLDVFYRKDYTTLPGEVEAAEANGDTSRALALLCGRPGLFVRRLFSTMLTCGAGPTIKAFRSIAAKLSPRLICSLTGAAATWFEADGKRSIALADGRRVIISPNAGASALTDEQKQFHIKAIKDFSNDFFTSYYASKGKAEGKIYIDRELDAIPMPVGDRGISVSAGTIALQGQQFRVDGNAVRLFLQWGEGLPAQHLDMDLSAKILYRDGSSADCAYYNLYPEGATHSGDIQYIPDRVGTAEYIELDLDKLATSGADFVIFSCNAYSCAELSPNLRVGWMNSSNPMTVSDDTGVAYDPSTVQQLVTVSQSPTRGLVFGILDVATCTITWLEIPDSHQRMEQFDSSSASAYLRKLRSKVTIGTLLRIYAQARGLSVADTPGGAEKVFDLQWAADSSAVALTLL